MPSKVDVSHREIYDRLMAVEQKVDKIDKATSDVVIAFDAAKGAFAALEMLGKIAKPILWFGSLVLATGVGWQYLKDHLK